MGTTEQSPMTLPRIYEILGNICFEKWGKKMVKRIPKDIIKKMCDKHYLGLSFETLNEKGSMFCAVISQTKELVIYQIFPDIVDENKNIVHAGRKETLMTFNGIKDITQLFKNPIWQQGELINQRDISLTQKTVSTSGYPGCFFIWIFIANK